MENKIIYQDKIEKKDISSHKKVELPIKRISDVEIPNWSQDLKDKLEGGLTQQIIDNLDNKIMLAIKEKNSSGGMYEFYRQHEKEQQWSEQAKEKVKVVKQMLESQNSIIQGRAEERWNQWIKDRIGNDNNSYQVATRIAEAITEITQQPQKGQTAQPETIPSTPTDLLHNQQVVTDNTTRIIDNSKLLFKNQIPHIQQSAEVLITQNEISAKPKPNSLEEWHKYAISLVNDIIQFKRKNPNNRSGSHGHPLKQTYPYLLQKQPLENACEYLLLLRNHNNIDESMRKKVYDTIREVFSHYSIDKRTKNTNHQRRKKNKGNNDNSPFE